jgi:hypothetical protein
MYWPWGPYGIPCKKFYFQLVDTRIYIYIYANIYAYVYPYNYESVHSVLVTEVCNTKARFTQWPPRQILAPAGQGDILMQTSRLCIWNSHAAMLGMLHAQCTSRRSHVSEMFWEIGPIGRPRLGDAKTNGSIKQHVKTNGWCFWASPSWSLSFRAEKT